MGGPRIKTRYKLYQSILQGKYWIAMYKALCLQAYVISYSEQSFVQVAFYEDT